MESNFISDSNMNFDTANLKLRHFPDGPSQSREAAALLELDDETLLRQATLSLQATPSLHPPPHSPGLGAGASPCRSQRRSCCSRCMGGAAMLRFQQLSGIANAAGPQTRLALSARVLESKRAGQGRLWWSKRRDPYLAATPTAHPPHLATPSSRSQPLPLLERDRFQPQSWGSLGTGQRCDLGER